MEREGKVEESGRDEKEEKGKEDGGRKKNKM